MLSGITSLKNFLILRNIIERWWKKKSIIVAFWKWYKITEYLLKILGWAKQVRDQTLMSKPHEIRLQEIVRIDAKRKWRVNNLQIPFSQVYLSMSRLNTVQRTLTWLQNYIDCFDIFRKQEVILKKNRRCKLCCNFKINTLRTFQIL